jgi:hypothetical protein
MIFDLNHLDDSLIQTIFLGTKSVHINKAPLSITKIKIDNFFNSFFLEKNKYEFNNVFLIFITSI